MELAAAPGFSSHGVPSLQDILIVWFRKKNILAVLVKGPFNISTSTILRSFFENASLSIVLSFEFRSSTKQKQQHNNAR